MSADLRAIAEAAKFAAWSPDRALAALDVIEAAERWRAGERAEADENRMDLRALEGWWAEQHEALAALRAALDRWEALG